MTVTRVILTVLAVVAALPARPSAAQVPVPQTPGVWRGTTSPHALQGGARRQLIKSLSRILGSTAVTFDPEGRLTLGDTRLSGGGSAVADSILRRVIASGDIFVIEDYSGSNDVTRSSR